jgi:hypothetical protein
VHAQENTNLVVDMHGVSTAFVTKPKDVDAVTLFVVTVFMPRDNDTNAIDLVEGELHALLPVLTMLVFAAFELKLHFQ